MLEEEEGNQYPGRGQMSSPPGQMAPVGHGVHELPTPHAQFEVGLEQTLRPFASTDEESV